MELVVEFLTVATIVFIPNIYASFDLLKNPSELGRQPVQEILASRLIYALSLVLLIILIALREPAGLMSVGFGRNDQAKNDLDYMVLLVYVAVSITLFLIRRRFGRSANLELDSNPAAIEVRQYLPPWDRLVHVTLLPTTVLAEELTYRGYLVLLLGQRTGMIFPWAVLSVTLSVLAHLYQGRNLVNIVSHLMRASFFVIVTVLTGDIQAAFWLHLFINIVFAFHVWGRAEPASPPPARSSFLNKRISYSVMITVNLIMILVIALVFQAIT